MYNNEITYNQKWTTRTNKKALNRLTKKYLDDTECFSHCPFGWAPEVLELIELLDAKFGIAKNELTYRGFSIRKDILRSIFIDPLVSASESFKLMFFTNNSLGSRAVGVFAKIVFVVNSYIKSLRYGLKYLKVLKINPIINRINKPKLQLHQVKEKFGRLIVYFDIEDPKSSEFIEREIAKTEIKLALKGCYYPIESIVAKDSVHESIIKDMGVSLNVYLGTKDVNIELQ
jgi:hypothetical protein